MPAAEVSVKDGYRSTPTTGTDQHKPLVLHSKRSQENMTLNLYSKPSVAEYYRHNAKLKAYEVTTGAGH